MQSPISQTLKDFKMAYANEDSPLSCYHDDIVSWYFLENKTIEETRQLLLTTFPEVQDKGPTTVTQGNHDRDPYPSPRTLERLLCKWGYRKNVSAEALSADHLLRERMLVLFYEFGLSDREMAEFLRREGYCLSDNL